MDSVLCPMDSIGTYLFSGSRAVHHEDDGGAHIESQPGDGDGIGS